MVYLLRCARLGTRLSGRGEGGAGVRGVLILAAGLSAGLSPLAALLVTGALFGVNHLYQGWLGMLGTTMVGVVLTPFVLGTGSLLFAAVLHILIDIRALLFVPPEPTPTLSASRADGPAPASTPGEPDKDPDKDLANRTSAS